MRALRAFSLAALTLGALPAFADPNYSFSLTDSSGVLGQVTFQLDPSTFTTELGDDFTFNSVAAQVNGNKDDLTVVIYPLGEPGDDLFLGDAQSFDQGTFLTTFASGDPSVGPPQLQTGSYAGFVQCDTKLQSPFGHSGPSASLAFLQLPVSLPCGDQLTLDIGRKSVVPPPPTTGVTPEPSSLGLFGSGVLGLVGLVRRRQTQI